VEFRLLGALEVVDGDRKVALGGARQRAFLTLLLLHRNEVVTPDRIAEELWGGNPPRTAPHAIRVYVSHLRKVLEPERGDADPQVLVTRGSGYVLRTRPDEVDLDRFEAARADARRLRAEGRDAEAAAALAQALALWRGPALHDVAYETFAQAETARLEELRLATCEEQFDAQLDAGEDAMLVADLEQLVAANPLRERLRGQLMLSLYRSGRQADALAVYSDGRRVLVDELGLEPAAELSELQARILRHDPELDRPTRTRARRALLSSSSKAKGRIAIGAAVLVAVAGIVATIVAATTGGAAANRHVTVVMPNRPQLNPPAIYAAFLEGVRAARHDLGADVSVVYTGYREFDPSAARPLAATLTRAAERSGLVIAGPLPCPGVVARVARAHPHTKFFFGEYPISKAPFNGMANVSGVSYDNREIGYLAGFLAAAMTPNGAVSVVKGVGGVTSVEQLTAGFRAGAHAGRPGIRVLVGNAGTFSDQSRCEELANSQIDAGSKVVFDAAGDCGRGALQAADIRGVWGIGVDEDLSYLGSHILASAVKRLDRGSELAIKLFLDDALPPGGMVHLDLATDSVGLVGINERVPAAVRERLEQVAAELRKRDVRLAHAG
jgi:DNA-binding SARP family transcriptional activator/basic membrane lipoprotein Med (substrate-binding protein (PBP1-ABC) superfamily)